MDEAYYKSGLSACVGKGDLIFATAETLGGGSEINSGFFLDLPKTCWVLYIFIDNFESSEPHDSK